MRAANRKPGPSRYSTLAGLQRTERPTMVIDNEWKFVKDLNRQERLALEALPR